ncbi:hypothetical protein RAS2_28500 [Phycisphaerae bacterium RAS2]|nr:hypothetical protein RAS2_28500 [Phycisphaerae bacterium RAS2]
MHAANGLKRHSSFSPFRLAISAIAIGTILSAAASARAGIIGVSGGMQQIAAPGSVVTGELESDASIFVFAERSGFTLPQIVNVSISQPGTSPGPSGRNLSPATIPAGTQINTYYIHYDKIGTGQARSATGSITFDEEILGLIIGGAGLLGTNALIGLPSTAYPPGQDHQSTELGDGSSVTLSADRRTVSVTLRVTCCADNIRVITAASPGAAQTASTTITNGGDGPGIMPSFNCDTSSHIDCGGMGTRFCGAFGGNIAAVLPAGMGAQFIAGRSLRRRRTTAGQRE